MSADTEPPKTFLQKLLPPRLLKIDGNKRLAGEGFEAFRKRRTAENKLLKRYLRGRVIWDTATRGQYRFRRKL